MEAMSKQIDVYIGWVGDWAKYDKTKQRVWLDIKGISSSAVLAQLTFAMSKKLEVPANHYWTDGGSLDISTPQEMADALRHESYGHQLVSILYDAQPSVLEEYVTSMWRDKSKIDNLEIYAAPPQNVICILGPNDPDCLNSAILCEVEHEKLLLETLNEIASNLQATVEVIQVSARPRDIR
jgi:hypothetical protein